MVYIAYFTELNSKIWDYAQKRRICRENCKYALDERFHGHFCPRRKAAKSCHPGQDSEVEVQTRFAAGVWPVFLCWCFVKVMKCGNVYYRKVWRLSYITFQMIPSIVARGISWSGDREESMMALPRMRQRESLPNNWLVTSFSSSPLLLARAVARSFTWPKASEWKPPKVSRANGKNTSPSCRQASSVSLFFLRQALSSEAPGYEVVFLSRFWS